LACKSRGLWLQCLSQFTLNIAWNFLPTWLPSYFKDTYKIDMEASGYLTAIPFLAGVGGTLLGGVATDWLTRRLGLRWGRSLMGIASQFLGALGLAVALFAPNQYVAVAGFAFFSFASDLLLGALFAYFQDTGGPFVGTLLGWANMCGNAGGVVSPKLWVFLETTRSTQFALAAFTGMMVVSGLCWFGVDARVPIVPEQSIEEK
jgi:nitrate/nitrite transporter NarK